MNCTCVLGVDQYELYLCWELTNMNCTCVLIVDQYELYLCSD